MNAKTKAKQKLKTKTVELKRSYDCYYIICRLYL